MLHHLLNERIRNEYEDLQNGIFLRQLLNGEELIRLEQLITGQQAVIAELVEQRQEILANPNLVYWRPGTRLNPIMEHFTQLRYRPFSECKPDFDMALKSIISDCGMDIRRMVEGYGAAKVWLTVQVRYEPANPRDEKHKPFEFYLTSAATRFYRGEPITGGDGAPYAEPLRELFERIQKLNANFIKEQSGLVLADILQLVIRGVRYDPLAGRGLRELPPYLISKKAIVNIQNTDDRCF